MTDRFSAVLHSPRQGHEVFVSVWHQARDLLAAGKRLTLVVSPEKRTSDQNRLLWAALGDLSAQVDWYGEKLSPEDWKNVVSASLKKQRAVRGIDGGFVVLGQSTSRMSKAEFSELIELIYAFGAERGVTFKEQA
jgi:hypothetical protein